MTIRQSRYILAETDQERRVRVTEVQRAEGDPFIRKSEIQQTVNNSTLPVSSRAVNLAIESINSNLNLKADKTELEGLATEDYVNEKIGEKDIGITEPELISKSVGSGKWMREGAYGLGEIGSLPNVESQELREGAVGFYRVPLSRDRPQGSDGIGMMLSFGNVSDYTSQMYRGALDTSLYLRCNVRGEGAWGILYYEGNTTADKNRVLHSGTKTPLDTLNVSDMADTVVDNDLLTVTSGAVFRAIKQLTDQITSLEARVRELEDGGI